MLGKTLKQEHLQLDTHFDLNLSASMSVFEKIDRNINNY